MLRSIESIHSGGRYRIKDREKARVFQEVAMHPLCSRKNIATATKIRPTTISTAIQELIDERLVVESGSRENEGRGRPEILLQINENRFVVLSMHVSARRLHTAMVNLKEESIFDCVEDLHERAGNEEFLDACERCFKRAVEHLPEGSDILGVAISLIGTVSSTTRTWISVARWHNISDLDFTLLEKRIRVPVIINRVQDAELLEFIQKNRTYSQKNIAFIHWGFGIGGSYAHKGKILGSSLGRFSEIGHSRLSLADTKRCQCGAVGCIETVAALWALYGEGTRAYQTPLTDEQHIGQILKDIVVDEHADIQQAIEYMNLAIMNLYQHYFPDTVVVLGPFVENEEIFRRLSEFFYAHIPEYARANAEFIRLAGRTKEFLPSSTYPLFFRRLKRELTFSDGRKPTT